MKHTKSAMLLLTLLFLLQVSALPVFAGSWYDVIHSGSYEPIKGQGYVAETFYGVDALYNENDAAYQCNELIIRFYKEAYGLDVFAWGNTGLVMLTKGYEFKEADTPRVGDVVFSSSANRNGKGDHWAIVKDYSGGTITLFEQNVVYNGKAGTGRTLDYPSPYYTVYTPAAKNGYPAPQLHNARSGSAAREEPVTEPTTTAVPSSKPTSEAAAKSTTKTTTTTMNSSAAAPSSASGGRQTEKASSAAPKATHESAVSSGAASHSAKSASKRSSKASVNNTETYGTNTSPLSTVSSVNKTTVPPEEIAPLAVTENADSSSSRADSAAADDNAIYRGNAQTRKALVIGSVLTGVVIVVSIVLLAKKNQVGV